MTREEGEIMATTRSTQRLSRALLLTGILGCQSGAEGEGSGEKRVPDSCEPKRCVHVCVEGGREWVGE